MLDLGTAYQGLDHVFGACIHVIISLQQTPFYTVNFYRLSLFSPYLSLQQTPYYGVNCCNLSLVLPYYSPNKPHIICRKLLCIVNRFFSLPVLIIRVKAGPNYGVTDSCCHLDSAFVVLWRL